MDTGGQQVENSPLTTLSIKRKADEAFDALDDALRTKESRPSPSKRTLYGSLSKYGILPSKPKDPSSKVITPILSGLLSRSRKAKKPASMLHTAEPTSSFTPDYSPGSTEAFLKRLVTYQHSTYSSKPQAIDAVAASKAGWINEGGKDRLYCAICRVGWVLAGREGMTKEAAAGLVEKQAQQLVDMHKEGCPWRVRQCDPLVYRIPLQSPANMARSIKFTAREIESLLNGIQVRHPLTTNQVQSFVQVVHSIPPASRDSEPAPDTSALLSPTSLLVSLFGWSLVPPPPSIVRESSAAKFARTYSRATSVLSAPSREGTPIPSVAPSSQFNTPIVNRILPSVSQPATPNLNGTNSAAVALSSPNRPPPLPLTQKNAMLQCKLCQRRLGLWAFAPPEAGPSSSSTTQLQRQLDLLREHRASCPYVAKSTPLPSISFSATPASTPRTSFDLIRSGTSLSLIDAPSSAASSAKQGLRRTASFISGLRSGSNGGPSHIRNRSLPAVMQESELVEGWRAVYNTVMRYGMAERVGHLSRLSADGARRGVVPVLEDTDKEEENNDDAMSGVVEIVENVKRNGGRQLMSYVRNLLG